MPELLPESTPLVIVAEGKKDCDNLVPIGVSATCNAGGSGNWTADHSEFLRGRRVIVLADNDEAGSNHAQQVVQSVHDVAKSVQIVQLPGLPPRGHARDWIAARGKKDELRELAESTPLWKPEEQPGPELIPFDSMELPAFPTGALPEVLRQWVEAESHTTQTPADLAADLAKQTDPVLPRLIDESDEQESDENEKRHGRRWRWKRHRSRRG